jgi:hypothetical protein
MLLRDCLSFENIMFSPLSNISKRTKEKHLREIADAKITIIPVAKQPPKVISYIFSILRLINEVNNDIYK